MKAGPLAAAVIALMTQTTPSSATTIQFLDLTESHTALVCDPPPLTKVDTSISESSWLVGLRDFLQAASGGYQAQFALTELAEDDGSADSLSDVLQFSVPLANLKELDVILNAIPADVGGLTFYETTDENRSLQISDLFRIPP